MRGIDESLVDHLVATYEIGPAFARAYILHWNSGARFRIEAPGDIDTLPNPERMWFRFAMSANTRGRVFLTRYRGLFEARRRSYLDIGCGVGGFLVAFAADGFEVHGLEILD
jgi:hypothetical protein